MHRNLVHFLSASLTAAPGVPGLWPPAPFSLPGCGSAAPPVGPLTSCSLSQRSSVGTRVDAQAPPGNPRNAYCREWKESTLTWKAILVILSKEEVSLFFQMFVSESSGDFLDRKLLNTRRWRGALQISDDTCKQRPKTFRLHLQLLYK